jgi:hypothetical protein
MLSLRAVATPHFALALVALACGGISDRHPTEARPEPAPSSGTAGTSGGAAGTATVGGGTAGTSGGAAGTATAGGAVNGGTADTAPCVNPACPEAPPANGDACGGCRLPPLACGWDERAVDGLTYTAVCSGAEWFVSTSEDLTVACCSTDADCTLTACSDGCIEPVCVNGSCMIAYQGECWRDDQCSSDQACSGAVICAYCTDPGKCLGPDQAGICVPKGEGCCLADGDCSGGGHCIQGVCKIASSSGCYTVEDCGFAGECIGASVCTCGTTCPGSDTEGRCEHMR